jgi:DNA-binding MarR family transcriptional regulator
MSLVTDTQLHGSIDEAIDDAEEQLSVLFGRVRIIMKDASVQIHPELRPVGYKILAAIVRQGETNGNHLADVLETDKSVVSRQVRMLEDIGLVTSRADDKDGRARVLSPTPEAVERLKSVRSAQQKRLREILGTRSVDELRDFADMLRLISKG